MTKYLIALLSIGALTMAGTTASASINYTGGSYSENFDGMYGSSTTSSNTAYTAYTSTIGTQMDIAGVTGWQVAKISGTGTSAFSGFVNTGSYNAGGVYSFGASAGTDRALGLLASGSNVLAIGTELVNNTGSVIADVTISFTAEQWRSSTSAKNTLAFAYGLSGGDISSSNYLTSTSMANLTNLDAVGQDPVTTNGATDGNSLSNNVTFTITGLNIANGQSLFIRWSDTNDAGNDAGIGIDNFSIVSPQPAPVPEPASVGILALAGAGLLLRRRHA